jgi:hypothetical protein
LVTSSPEFDPPKRTPPYITQLVHPPAYQIIPIESRDPLRTIDPMDLEFELVSEDLQAGPVAQLGLDYKPRPGVGDNPVLIGSQDEIPPGHLTGAGAGPRRVTIKLEMRSAPSPGCHSITLMVTHAFKLGEFAPKDEGDVSLATWWAAIDADPTTFDLTSCIIPDLTPDGGVDSAAEATTP